MIGALLGHARFYQLFQSLLGAGRLRRTFVDRYLQPLPGQTLLELGCGPADLHKYLMEVNYVGVDAHPPYLELARRRLPAAARLQQLRLGGESPLPDGPFDRIAAVGLLHHLDDVEVDRLFAQCRAALPPGGRMATIDACWHTDQNDLSRWLVSRDRGGFVRHSEAYARLARRHFDDVEVQVHHGLLRIPYTHAALVCR